MTSTLDFASFARDINRGVRARGLMVVSFRSPPATPGVDRTIRRVHATQTVVAVRTKGRPQVAVAADMIEGVVVANRLTGPAAADLRALLWEIVGLDVGVASSTTPPCRTGLESFGS